MKRIYLEDKPWQEGLGLMMEQLSGKCIPRNEVVDVREALHRITGSIVYAKRSSPHYPASAMDGYAVRAKDTFGISERNPRWFALGSEALQVDTGDAIPQGMDAVVKIEEVLEQNENGILLETPAYPYQHVRSVGEDIAEGEVLLPIHHRIRPQDQGALLAAGVLKIAVRSKPKVGILPTGDEIRQPGSQLGAGEIIDSNSTVLKSLIEEWGGQGKIWSIAADQFDILEHSLLEMVKTQDILIIIAGSSQGRDDHTAALIAKYGRVLVHGAAIKPGKPVILGEIQNKPVIGIPGYPVSAYLTAQLFLNPWVKLLQGIGQSPPETQMANLSKKVYSALGSEEFVRIKLGKVGQRWVAAPLSRGAGATMSLVRADGIMSVPRLQEGFHEGEQVKIRLLRPLQELEETLIGIGSHDLTLELLNSHLKAKGLGALASAHVGSMAGLLALRKDEAHFAGIHLLDPESGEYNLSYLKRLLPGKDIALLNLVYRIQGLLVARGNPLGILTLQDLTRSDVRFINRQAGSGTRVLLDYLLQKECLPKDKILGYDREEFTHLGVAVAVASEMADVGLGIQSAAQSLHLDFIPIGEERYDLAIPREYLDDARMKAMLTVIQSEEFKENVQAMGGYDTRDTGTYLLYK